MGADSHKTAVVQQQDPVRILDRGEPMGHNKKVLFRTRKGNERNIDFSVRLSSAELARREPEHPDLSPVPLR